MWVIKNLNIRQTFILITFFDKIQEFTLDSELMSNFRQYHVDLDVEVIVVRTFAGVLEGSYEMQIVRYF